MAEGTLTSRAISASSSMMLRGSVCSQLKDSRCQHTTASTSNQLPHSVLPCFCHVGFYRFRASFHPRWSLTFQKSAPLIVLVRSLSPLSFSFKQPLSFTLSNKTNKSINQNGEYIKTACLQSIADTSPFLPNAPILLLYPSPNVRTFLAPIDTSNSPTKLQTSPSLLSAERKSSSPSTRCQDSWPSVRSTAQTSH
jgi:hypothetical protein